MLQGLLTESHCMQAEAELLQVRLQLPGRSPVPVCLIKEEGGALMSMRQLYCSLDHVVAWGEFHLRAKQGGACLSALQCARA